MKVAGSVKLKKGLISAIFNEILPYQSSCQVFCKMFPSYRPCSLLAPPDITSTKTTYGTRLVNIFIRASQELS